MPLLHISLSSIAGLMSCRRLIMSAGIVAAEAGGPPQVSAHSIPSHLKFFNPEGMSKPGGYSHVVEMTGPGRTIYIAGQLGYDASGKRAGEPGDFTAQATQCFENLKIALTAVGAGFEHVVKFNNFLIDIAHMPQFREVRSKFITGIPPAGTTVQISKLALPDALLEVEAIAVVAVR